MGRAGLVQRKVKFRAKSGKMAMRNMWVRADAKKPVQRVRGKPQQQGPGFLRRHAGKLVAGAALLGVAALNRHKIAGALQGAKAGHQRSLDFGNKTGSAATAHAMFQQAKRGWQANRGNDRAATAIANAAHGAGQRVKGALPTRQGLTDYRRKHGAALTSHLAQVGGEAAASHIGSRFGQVAGTAVGGALLGPAGAGIGGFLGGHAGGFLANRHTASHISRGAERLGAWMQR